MISKFFKFLISQQNLKRKCNHYKIALEKCASDFSCSNIDDIIVECNKRQKIAAIALGRLSKNDE